MKAARDLTDQHNEDNKRNTNILKLVNSSKFFGVNRP